MVPVPGFMLGKARARLVDALNGLTVTGTLFAVQSELEGVKSPLPDERSTLIDLVRAVEQIPTVDAGPGRTTLGGHERNRLLLSMRQLTVPRPAAADGGT